MMKVNKNLLVWVAVLVLIAVFAIWMMNSGVGPIEDTNGPDDYSLVTITDENIIKMDMGAITPIQKSGASVNIGGIKISSALKFSADNFSGVYEVMYNNFIAPSDVAIRLDYLKVNGGNFKMVVLLDGEIVTVIEPSDDPIEFMLEDIGGTVSLRIAGESADYEFSMSSADYDNFAHAE